MHPYRPIYIYIYIYTYIYIYITIYKFMNVYMQTLYNINIFLCKLMYDACAYVKELKQYKGLYI